MSGPQRVGARRARGWSPLPGRPTSGQAPCSPSQQRELRLAGGRGTLSESQGRAGCCRQHPGQSCFLIGSEPLLVSLSL